MLCMILLQINITKAVTITVKVSNRHAWGSCAFPTSQPKYHMCHTVTTLISEHWTNSKSLIPSFSLLVLQRDPHWRWRRQLPGHCHGDLVCLLGEQAALSWEGWWALQRTERCQLHSQKQGITLNEQWHGASSRNRSILRGSCNCQG